MPEVELGVIVFSYGKNFEKHDIDGIKYYRIPSASMSKIDNHQVDYCRQAISSFQPDLIHIHGTEHSLAQAVCLANDNNIKIVANIQGLAGPISRYADGGLSFIDKISNITPLDIYRNTLLLNVNKAFRKRARCENFVLTHITDVIGRTQWDHDHVMSINPKLHYHFMNETLRDSFYEEPKWNYKQCHKHTIFVSNSGAPLKGAHQVLKALPIILEKYPDTVVNFCGSSVMNNDLKSILHFQGYHLYLRKLVKKLKIQRSVRFLGSLSEREMKQAYLNAHVYVLPSSIENSSNSLCEAQILGVPVVASYCGGTPTLVEDGKTGFLYRYEEYEMLAQIVLKLFFAQDNITLSRCELQAATKRHNPINNAFCLQSIYQQIIDTNEK